MSRKFNTSYIKMIVRFFKWKLWEGWYLGIEVGFVVFKLKRDITSNVLYYLEIFSLTLTKKLCEKKIK